MASNPVASLGSGIISKILNSIVMFSLGVFAILIFLGTGYYFFIYQKKFDIEVKIYSDRSDDKYSIIYDKAAILTDRATKSKYLRIWGLKRDFPLPKFNVIQATSRGDLIELYRESENKFSYVLPPVIRKDVVMDKDGKLRKVARSELIHLDTDLDYWIVKRKNANKKMFDTESMLMKILPYVPILIGAVMMIFLLSILLNKLPQIIDKMTVLTNAINNLQLNSSHIAAARPGP